MAVPQPEPCQLRVEFSTAALPDDRVRDLGAAGLVIDLGHMHQVHEA